METAQKKKLISAILITLVFGSLWGLSEVALGGSLKASGFPYRAGLLTGVGFGLAGVAWAITRKPYVPAAMGAIAALVTLIAVPVLQCGIECRANSCLAIALEGGSLGLAAFAISGKARGVFGRGGSAILGAMVASVAFFYLGRNLAPCAYLLSFASPGDFVVKEGLVWAAFSGVLTPLGYALGEKLSARAPVINSLAIRFAGAAGIIAAAVGGSALALAAGL